MRTTTVDRDGTVRCPGCGGSSFAMKRTAGAKVGLGLTVGVGALLAPKRTHCLGCGEDLRSGGPHPAPNLNDEERDQYDAAREVFQTTYYQEVRKAEKAQAKLAGEKPISRRQSAIKHAAVQKEAKALIKHLNLVNNSRGGAR